MAMNCLEGLIDSIAGNANTDSEQRLHALADHMVSHSFFFPKEIVDKRHEEIISDLKNKKPLPTRYSTVPECYCNDDGTIPYFKNKKEAVNASGISYKFRDNKIPVKVDKDGNYSVRQLIRETTGHIISQGAISTITYATISHIWGQAFNPIFFTSLWNIVIVPTYCNPILDKSDDLPSDDVFAKEVAYINNVYKKICFEHYDVKKKLEDFKRLGFDVTDYVSYDDVDYSIKELPSFPEITEKVSVKTNTAKTDVCQAQVVSPTADNQTAAEDSLKRDLQTVGMKTFVDFYEAFADPEYTLTDIKSMLDTCGYSLNSINTKASIGRRIIRNGQGQEALEMILQAAKIDENTRQRAEELLNSEREDSDMLIENGKSK